jgi:hypothetical protein
MNDRLITDPAFFVRGQKTKLGLCVVGFAAIAVTGQPYLALAGAAMLSASLLAAYATERMFRLFERSGFCTKK